MRLPIAGTSPVGLGQAADFWRDGGVVFHAGEVPVSANRRLGRGVSALEQDLKVSLFHRHAHGLVFTGQGELLLLRTAREDEFVHHLLLAYAATPACFLDELKAGVGGKDRVANPAAGRPFIFRSRWDLIFAGRAASALFPSVARRPRFLG